MNYLRLARYRKLPPPDFIVGDGPKPYLRRWYLIPRNRWFNVYLHHFCRSDDDRALHDHPWRFNLSVLLHGNYYEHTPKDCVVRKAGSIVFKNGVAPHRIELFFDPKLGDVPVWTLFITGAKFREWGFYCPRGWKLWQEFTKRGNPGEVGAGCGEG